MYLMPPPQTDNLNSDTAEDSIIPILLKIHLVGNLRPIISKNGEI